MKSTPKKQAGAESVITKTTRVKSKHRALPIRRLPSAPVAGGEIRRTSDEWEALDELLGIEGRKGINAASRSGNEWRRLKEVCTAGEWRAIVKGGEVSAAVRAKMEPSAAGFAEEPSFADGIMQN